MSPGVSDKLRLLCLAGRALQDQPDGMLNLSVRPWAQVVIDGQPLDKPTPVRNHRLAAGWHTILLKGPGGKEQTLKVNVPAGKTVTKVLSFD